MIPKRYGMVLGLKAGKVEEYKRLHRAVWPDVCKMITAANIRNFSIYLKQLDDGNYYLFNHFEYAGADFSSDMARIAADPVTRRWLELCMPCQTPVKNRATDEWWSQMEEVFHLD